MNTQNTTVPSTGTPKMWSPYGSNLRASARVPLSWDLGQHLAAHQSFGPPEALLQALPKLVSVHRSHHQLPLLVPLAEILQICQKFPCCWLNRNQQHIQHQHISHNMLENPLLLNPLLDSMTPTMPTPDENFSLPRKKPNPDVNPKTK